MTIFVIQKNNYNLRLWNKLTELQFLQQVTL